MLDTPHEEQPTLGKRMTWFAILWLLGFVFTVLLAMPFHFLVVALQR
ncbi:hypothetical protein AB4Y44_13380 [Paraburkholderia sp. BR10937]